STMLGWHYRSRDEALITFSNRVFYDGKLLTVPAVTRSTTRRPIIATEASEGAQGADALLERSISFHLMKSSPYEQRRNVGEARYIAELVRGLLRKAKGRTIGVVAFSEAQQGEIETALSNLGAEDPEFQARYEAEMEREENGQFVGLFVKNLENVQGDERDIIVISVCYAPDARGKMLMNFGPINKTGGEKRLNVIFSRAKHHLAVVSSVRWSAITNDYNDGAACLRNYLRYAEAVSTGSTTDADVALASYRKAAEHDDGERTSALEERLAKALRARGHDVDIGIGTSEFRCNLGVRERNGDRYQLGILLDDVTHQAQPIDEVMQVQPSVLHGFGWNTMTVLHKDWWSDPELVLRRIETALAVPS
ncbi:MAG: AAA domain-containing protein, partial [Polyangiaceae bacterium]